MIVWRLVSRRWGKHRGGIAVNWIW